MIGADLSLWWGIPFAGLLLSIAILPLVAHDLWHDHYGKIALAWVLALLIPFTFSFGTDLALHEVAHVVLAEYLPFIVVLFALFTISGGICIHGQFRATPERNTAILALGAMLASIMGTTGASMLLIRPLLTANEHRRIACTRSCSSSCWSATSAARCRRSAILRCSSAF